MLHAKKIKVVLGTNIASLFLAKSRGQNKNAKVRTCTIILINGNNVLHCLIFPLYFQIYKVITQCTKIIQAPKLQQGLGDIFLLFCGI